MKILASKWRSAGNVLWLGLLVPWLFPATAGATTLYVDDDNAAVCPCNQPPGTTCGPTNNPFSCINDALANQIGGSYADTIIVRDGTYNENVSVTHGGTSDTQRLTIKADHIHGALLSGPSRASIALYIASKYVTVQGFRITGGSTGFYVAGEDRTDGSQPTNQGLGIVVEDTEIFGNVTGVLLRMTCANVRMTRVDVHDNAPYDGIKLDTYHDPDPNPPYPPLTCSIFNTIIENSHIHHNHNQGIGEGNGINTIVRNSEIDHNGTSGEEHGFYVKGVSGLIQGNKVHHNSGYGIQLWAAPKGTSSQHYIVERNDVFENGSGGIVLGGSFAEANQPTNDGFPHYVEIRYNLLHHNPSGFVFYGGGCDPSLDPSNDNSFHHNTVYNNSQLAFEISGLQNTPSMRLLLKNNILAGPQYVSGMALVLLISTNLSADDIDGNIYYMPGATSSTALFDWSCYNCTTPPPTDTLYSFDQIRTSGIVQDNTRRPELNCGSPTTVKLDERSRWTDPMVVDATTASWPNSIGMTMGDYHLRRNSPAISGGVCCSISTPGSDYDGELPSGCLPQSCASQNSAVAVGADWYQDSNSNGVADRNECNPPDGTVCDCNTQYASNCSAEIPETPEGSESACVALGNPGAPYDSTVFPGQGEMCDGKDNDCNSSTTYSGGETDTDKDGFFGACQDCNDSDPNVNPGAVESPAILQTCFDGVDNDCDGVADLDCAIDAVPGSQVVSTGQVTCGSLSDLTATSLDDHYECLQELKLNHNYSLSAQWTFSTVSMAAGTDYELRVEGMRNSSGNDQFNFSASVKAYDGNLLCTSNDGGTSTIVSITDGPPDLDKLKPGDVGFNSDTVCVKLRDSNPTSDPNNQDTLSLDRLFLFPAPVALADYAAGSDIGLVGSSGYLPFEATQRSEDVYETLTEVISNGNNRLSHTWQFKSVPAGTGHVLHFEGHRTAAGTLDDFKFYYATSTAGWSDTDPTVGFTLISGATINTTSDPSGGVNSSAFGGTGSGTYYIRVIDAQNSGSGASQNTLYIDHLSIRTNP